jgi:hypothetical protein
MAGNLTIPNVFAGLGGQQAASLLDQDFNAIRDYINPREVTIGTLGARPAAGVSGRWYFATDDAGGTLYVDTGTAWVRVGIAVPTGGSFVRGLTGTNNATAPDTQFDLSAHLVQLQNPTDGTMVVRANTGTLTNNIAIQGANGRDQAAAFAASSWIHVYFIWNGSTLATVSSLTAPPTGPTLPSGYTHWAYATTIRYNATPVLVRSFVRGGWVFTQALTNLVLAGGVGTVAETAVDASAAVPPTATVYALVATVYVQPSFVTAIFFRLRLAPGIDFAVFRGAAQANNYDSVGGFVILPNVGASFLYALDLATGAINDRNTRIDCVGYRVPNGD